MNANNTNKLYTDFPGLYKRSAITTEGNEVTLGFDCEDGWFEIIYDLSINLRDIDAKSSIEALQICNKWGSLKFSVNISSTEINNLIDNAVQRAKTTCESCGAINAEMQKCRNAYM